MLGVSDIPKFHCIVKTSAGYSFLIFEKLQKGYFSLQVGFLNKDLRSMKALNFSIPYL